MALDVDGFWLLAKISCEPNVFPDIRMEAAKAARMLVVKQLKAKAASLETLRRIYMHLGGDVFALLADGFTDSEATSLVSKFDMYHPDRLGSPANWARRHLVALARGTEPAPRSPLRRSPPNGSLPTTRVPRALGHAAFLAKWDGTDHDARPAKAKKKAP